jgi:hypothetical protein
VVEGAALEMLYRGNSIEGSNPSLSVIQPARAAGFFWSTVQGIAAIDQPQNFAKSLEHQAAGSKVGHASSWTVQSASPVAKQSQIVWWGVSMGAALPGRCLDSAASSGSQRGCKKALLSSMAGAPKDQMEMIDPPLQHGVKGR